MPVGLRKPRWKKNNRVIHSSNEGTELQAVADGDTKIRFVGCCFLCRRGLPPCMVQPPGSIRDRIEARCAPARARRTGTTQYAAARSLRLPARSPIVSMPGRPKAGPRSAHAGAVNGAAARIRSARREAAERPACRRRCGCSP